MSDAMRSFERRAKTVRTSHKKLAGGYVQKVDKNGIVKLQPRTTISLAPVRYILLIALALVAFKGAVLVNLGTEAYLDTLTPFQIGSTGERFGAWLMQIDPLTAWIAETWTSVTA